MQVINDLSMKHDIEFYIIAETLEPVSTKWEGTHSAGQSIVPTHTFANALELDVFVIPGGIGGFHASPALLEYISKAGSATGNLLTVCNGSALAAQAGILDNKKATTNKAYWKQCVAYGPKVNWVAKARWVQDGNTWTSSGVSAGIDMTLAWVGSVFGDTVATRIANGSEYIRASSSDDDPFASKYACEDVASKP